MRAVKVNAPCARVRTPATRLAFTDLSHPRTRMRRGAQQDQGLSRRGSGEGSCGHACGADAAFGARGPRTIVGWSASGGHLERVALKSRQDW